MDLLRSVIKMRGPFERKPDFNRFLRAVTTPESGPVPIGDIFADYDTVGKYLNEKIFDYTALAEPGGKVTPEIASGILKYLDQSIRFCLGNGWDYTYCFSIIPFSGITYRNTDTSTVEEQGRKRYFMKDDEGPIRSWDDFERYAWPKDIHGINTLARLMARRVPDGMKVMVIPGGVFEWTTWLMGMVPFSYALSEQPDLVEALIARVSGLIYAVVEDLMDEPNIGGIFMGDDLGFATGTFVSPATLQRKFFPRTRQVVELVHSGGKAFVLHTCGNVYAVMDDLIGLGIDAKNSFEDKIMPVEEVYHRWGDRVALIGGVDMHLLASGDESQVRERTRQILDACGPGGHYVLGTGNSVANYLPLKNYQAMLDEGRKWNKEHFGREY
jgi:uroporphyrinogen decarboxylase